MWTKLPTVSTILPAIVSSRLACWYSFQKRLTRRDRQQWGATRHAPAATVPRSPSGCAECLPSSSGGLRANNLAAGAPLPSLPVFRERAQVGNRSCCGSFLDWWELSDYFRRLLFLLRPAQIEIGKTIMTYITQSTRLQRGLIAKSNPCLKDIRCDHIWTLLRSLRAEGN